MKLESRKYRVITSVFAVLIGLVSVGYAEEIRLSPQGYWEIKQASKTFNCPSNETLASFVREMKGKSVFSVEIEDASRVTEAGLTVLAELPIRELHITHGTFEGKCLGRFQELCVLQLWECTKLTDDGINAVAQIPTLVDLTIGGTPGITSVRFEKIAQMRQLRNLSLYLEQLEANWFLSSNLEKLSGLETLVIAGHFENDIFEAVSRFPNLKHLSVSQWTHVEPMMMFMTLEPEMPSSVDMLRTTVWDWEEIAKSLGKLRHLESLELIGGFTDNEENSFFPANFAKLKCLVISEMNVSKAFLDKMYENMPLLQVLNLPETLQNATILQKFMKRNPVLDICTSGKNAIKWAMEETTEEEME